MPIQEIALQAELRSTWTALAQARSALEERDFLLAAHGRAEANLASHATALTNQLAAASSDTQALLARCTPSLSNIFKLTEMTLLGGLLISNQVLLLYVTGPRGARAVLDLVSAAIPQGHACIHFEMESHASTAAPTS